ncbi:hypothetical protein E6H36_07855, partial [Candidatus Bathyarchaeota archaeon]
MRRSPLLITLLVITFLGTSLSASAFAQPVSSSLVQEKLQLACSFLRSLYNPWLQLVRSTANSSVYYVTSDNFLAE